jgi:hypothetical protein
VTTGNTMAPCIIIGERDAEILAVAHNLSGSEARSDLALASRKPHGCFSKTTNQVRPESDALSRKRVNHNEYKLH